MTTVTPAVRWRRLDLPGTDAARLIESPNSWRLAGSAEFDDGPVRWRLAYEIICDGSWTTIAATVRGARDGQPIDVRAARDSSGRWSLDGHEVPAVAGCIDVDLAFSPATNLLSLRRLNLEVGQEATVVAAWVTFPELSLAPLRQVYRRTSRNTYAYGAPDLDFAATLRVDDHGFVLEYGDLWHADPTVGAEA